MPGFPRGRCRGERRAAIIVAAMIAAAAGLGIASANPTERSSEAAPEAVFDAAQWREAFVRPEEIPAPPDNPTTPEKVALGRELFDDARLSGSNGIACSSCHQPDLSFSDGVSRRAGLAGERLARRTPPLLNLAWGLTFFWDGRAGSLEDQALGPIANPIEMGNTHDGMIATLSRVQGYKPYFKEAFGTEEITKERVAQAIADYERTRVSGNSPYDRWRFNHEQDAVSAAAKRGHDLFFDTAGCVQCHTGSSFSDSLFHNTGVGWDPKTKTFKDEGRFAVTKKPEDRGAFKTPVLRDVSKHAPYMHDGSIATLREVVELYNKGGIANPYLTKGRIKPLGLKGEDVDAIVAFLESLDGQGYQDTPPTTFPQ
jgi:cytochrome c peroxidase